MMCFCSHIVYTKRINHNPIFLLIKKKQTNLIHMHYVLQPNSHSLRFTFFFFFFITLKANFQGLYIKLLYKIIILINSNQINFYKLFLLILFYYVTVQWKLFFHLFVFRNSTKIFNPIKLCNSINPIFSQ